MFRYKFAIIIVSLLFVVGCARPEGKTPSAKRSSILQIHNQTLTELYSKQPQSRSQIRNAAGYAVFSNVDTTVLFIGGGGGYGVAVNKKNGKKTYMKMGQASVGLGVGLKDLREVIIFNREYDFRKFIVDGWDFGAEAGAGVKSGDKGGEVSGAATIISEHIIIYQLTEAGLELKSELTGRKYWLDDELNNY